MSNKDVYEVYVAYSLSGKPLYVGQGLEGRHTHCLSGCSHSKLLNRYYFNNGEENSMVVKVINKGLTREQALGLEKDLIYTLQPDFNIGGKIPAIHLVDFKTNYVTLTTLMKYRNSYRPYFASLATLDTAQIVNKIYDETNVAKDLIESGNLNNLIRICGEFSLVKCPFLIKCNGEWVLNEASYNLFDSTAEEIKHLF